MPETADDTIQKKDTPFSTRTVTDISAISAHTRHVRMMRLLLPSLSALLIGSILIWPSMLKERNSLISSNSPSLKNIEMMTVVNPSFQSTDKNNNPFNLSAKNAFEKSKSLIILKEPKGDIFINKKDMLAFTAENGEYNRDKQNIKFYKDVTFISDKGYTINTEEALVDIKSKDMTGNSDIVIQSDNGTITGKGFKIENNGERVIINGKVKMVLKDGKLSF